MTRAIGIAIILIASAVLAVKCTSNRAEDGDDFEDRATKNEAIKRPFFVGSRYGRSDYYGSKGSKHLSIAPRNDRFFIGSRYGKRSQELTTNNFSHQLEDPAETSTSDVPLVCVYTGVSDLFRCKNNGHHLPTDSFSSSEE